MIHRVNSMLSDVTWCWLVRDRCGVQPFTVTTHMGITNCLECSSLEVHKFMPFKSIAQKEKMEEFLRLGKISQKAFDEMSKDMPKDLPERKHPKKDDK